MKIKSVNLETVCGITSTLPDNPCAEVAFAGKSNVGKSSLINALMNRKALARTSAQPGKTQTINFYNVNDKMYLVDLPGYGYANANVEIKAKWGQNRKHKIANHPLQLYIYSTIIKGGGTMAPAVCVGCFGLFAWMEDSNARKT